MDREIKVSQIAFITAEISGYLILLHRNSFTFKALKKRKQLAKFRFKSLCRKVIVNAYWLSAIEDTTLGSNPRRNINILVRRSGKKGILTLKVFCDFFFDYRLHTLIRLSIYLIL